MSEVSLNIFPAQVKCKTLFIIVFLLVFLAPGLSAQINDTFHINIQTTDSTGDIVTGTFNFAFNVTESSNQTVCENPVYNHSSTQATDTRGIVSLYLPTVGSGGGNLSALNFDKQYYLCYSRDGELKDVSQLGRVPYSFRATQVNLSEIDIDSNLTLGDFNVSASSGFFDFLGEVGNRITGLFIQDINASGDVDVTGNVSANWFFGAFNWIVGPDSQLYLDFNGTQLDFNESNLNGTIDSRISEGQGDLHVNMSDYWNTGDRSALRNISEIMGSWFVNDLNWINFTDGDGRYVLLTDEPDLNVNRSEWWRTDEGDLDNVGDLLGSWISNDLAWINFTEGDTRYLLITDEANLDVNSSNFWRTNEGNKENVEDILGSEITNDLNWINQTVGNQTYVLRGGDTVSGDYLFNNNFEIGQNLTVGTNLLFADTNSNLVGIGTVTPQNKLNVVGDINGTQTVYAGEFSGPINWTFLQNYPNACPAGQAVQQIGDTLTCIDVDPENVVNGSGTLNTIPRWVAGNELGDSIISQDAGASEVTISGNLNINDLLADGDINVTGRLDVGTDLGVSGDASVSGSADVDGNLTIGTNALFVDSDGNVVGIGTVDPSHELNVIGDANVTGTVFADSFVESGENLSDKYVLKAGDTMTGGLIIAGSNSDGVALNVTGNFIVNESSGKIRIPGLSASRLLALDSSNDVENTNLVAWIDGTANQISVSDDGSGGVILSLPQDINTTSSPTFSQLTLSALTQGSVLFSGPGGLISQNNANFFWDNDTGRLGIGTNNPQNELNVEGDANVTDNLYVGDTRIFTDANGDTIFRLNG
ncbi:MAG: hypothetical protein WDZ69_01845 [Candidatus Pacearchaeota archaeon]